MKLQPNFILLLAPLLASTLSVVSADDRVLVRSFAPGGTGAGAGHRRVLDRRRRSYVKSTSKQQCDAPKYASKSSHARPQAGVRGDKNDGGKGGEETDTTETKENDGKTEDESKQDDSKQEAGKNKSQGNGGASPHSGGSVKGSGSNHGTGTGTGTGTKTGAGSGGGSSTGSSEPSITDGKSLTVRGQLSSGKLPAGQDWSLLSTSMQWKGKGTTFGGSDGFWQGGACMYDDLPHENLPSLAMNERNWLGGFACGSCVEIQRTPISTFKPGTDWTMQSGVKTSPNEEWKDSVVAFVSDWCPGMQQCKGGLDLHQDAWKQVTGSTDGTELMMHWRFVSCEDLFKKSGSGGKALEVKWRDGASQGFCNFQIRGAYRPVIQVEYSIKGKGYWGEAKHRDMSFFDVPGCGPSDTFAFRLTSADGEVIESVGGYVAIGQNMIFDDGINFARANTQSAYASIQG